MRWLAALGVLVLVFAVAGCGGSSDSTSTPTAASTETTDTTAAETETEDVDSDVQAVIEATEESYGAVIDHDAEAVCETSTSSFEAAVRAFAGGGSCEEAVAGILEKISDEQIRQEERELEELGPDNVVIKGDKAFVTFPHEEMIFVRSGDRWLNEGSHDRD